MAYSIVHKNLAFTNIVIAFALLLNGCATAPRPEVIYFEAQPKHPKAGDSVELKWHTENAVEVEISEIGINYIKKNEKINQT